MGKKFKRYTKRSGIRQKIWLGIELWIPDMQATRTTA